MTFPHTPALCADTPRAAAAHRIARKAGFSTGLIAGLAMLGGCVSDHGKVAVLDTAAIPQHPAPVKATATASPDLVPGVMVARKPDERYTDPLIVSAAPAQTPATADPTAAGTPVALDTPPPAPQEGPANLRELTMQPTTVSASSNSLFANQQLAYAGAPATSNAGSIVPPDMPVRRGIRPSLASVYSAPQPQPAAEMPVAAQPDGGYLLKPQHGGQAAPVEAAYDAAEPMPATEPAPAATPEKKGFSLMRLLGRSGS